MQRLLLGLLALLGAVASAAAAGRVALVVGVASYAQAPRLEAAANDAVDIGAALRRLGFEVELIVDPDKSALDAGVERLAAKAVQADAALFYFSGHAVAHENRNLLLTRDAGTDFATKSITLDAVIERMRGAQTALLFVEAGRPNPFSSGRADGGLAAARSEIGQFIAFATDPGNLVADATGRNSRFTGALLQNIEKPGLDLDGIMRQTRLEVIKATAGRQVPWTSHSLTLPFSFAP